MDNPDSEAASVAATEDEDLAVMLPGLLNGVPTAGPRRIVDPLDKLRAKYYTRGRAWSYANRDFDLYIAQRSAVPNWTDRIEGADLYATLLMRSRVRTTESDDLMMVARRVEAVLVRVPQVNLEVADLGSIQRPLQALFRACRRSGFSIAKITKLLCQKRPQLIPMLDSQVLTAIGGVWPASSTPSTFAQEGIAAVSRFRDLMTWTDGQGQDNLALLLELARSFTIEFSDRLSAEGVALPHPEFTPVRILDSLLWFEFGGGERYSGYLLDPQTGTLVPGDSVEGASDAPRG
jgi:uncharacterized protein DUF6308